MTGIEEVGEVEGVAVRSEQVVQLAIGPSLGELSSPHSSSCDRITIPLRKKFPAFLCPGSRAASSRRIEKEMSLELKSARRLNALHATPVSLSALLPTVSYATHVLK